MIRQENNDGVSPVIGVILMVAITVIIAAVVANFVLNLGQSLEEEPTATVTFDQEIDNFADQEYNITATVSNMGNTDYLVIGTVGNAGDDFFDGNSTTLDDTAMNAPQFGTYEQGTDENSVTVYSGVYPTDVDQAPNHAGQSESLPSATDGAVLVSAGDQVTVTGLNDTEQVQVFGGIEGREAQFDSVTVEGTL